MTRIVSRGARATSSDVERRRLPQVLGVVDDEQQVLRPRARARAPPRGPRPGGGRRRAPARMVWDDERGIAERRELDEHGAVRERRSGPAGGLESEPRLAAPARAGEHDEADVVALEQPDELRRARVRGRRASIRRHGQRRAGVAVGGRDLERRILSRMRCCSVAEHGPGSSPSSSSSRACGRRIVRERLRLPARSGRARASPAPAAARATGCSAARPRTSPSDLGVTAQRELRVDPLLDGAPAAAPRAARLVARTKSVVRRGRRTPVRARARAPAPRATRRGRGSRPGGRRPLSRASRSKRAASTSAGVDVERVRRPAGSRSRATAAATLRSCET